MWRSHLGIALHVLRLHKLRALLTVLSITVGAFSVVLMSSLADAGLATLSAGLEEMGGLRLISLWRRPPEDRQARRLQTSEAIARGDAAALRQVSYVRDLSQFALVKDAGLRGPGGTSARGDVVAADPWFAAFFHYQIRRGRPLTGMDEDRHAGVCLVGDGLAQRLWRHGEEVLGSVVRLPAGRCQVVGQLSEVRRGDLSFGWDWNEVLIMPLHTLADRSPAALSEGRQIFLRTDSPRHNEMAARIVRAVLLARHRGLSDFALFDFNERLTGLMKVFRIMKVVLGLLASIALLVGGMGIMNIMLVSVSERVREIGIRKALGASPDDITVQFLIEAVLLSGTGGAAGVLLGTAGAVLGAQIIRHFKADWIGAVSVPAILAALLLALGVGVAFGVMPARRAGRLEAVVSMRAGQ